MRFCSRLALLGLLILSISLGCKKEDGNQDSKETKTAKKNGAEPEHQHDAAEKLVWKKENIEYDGFTISLGHHGDHFHGGNKIEPSVSLTKDAKPIGDATVFCQLMDPDGKTPLSEDVALIFEPETKSEPAHYAGGEITFPKDEKTYMISFRISPPGVAVEYVGQIPVKVGH